MDGILVVAKPAGPTSHDIVALVRRLTATRKVGHGGTLDPFASGVLPVFLGLAVKVVEYHMGDPKVYRATICFGSTSTTDDRGGELAPTGGPAPSRADVEGALTGFVGHTEQRPPDYSAIQVGGRRAYHMAREGKPAELKLRAVEIERFELVEWDAADPERPIAVVDVACSAGTYVRSLARDLGEKLGCGAYLGSLVRTASGPFGLESAHSLDEIREAAGAAPGRLANLLLPVDAGLERFPVVTLDDTQVLAASRGQNIRMAESVEAESVRLRSPQGDLIGLAVGRKGVLTPNKMFIPAPGTVSIPGGGDGRATAYEPPTTELPLRQVMRPSKGIVVRGVSGLTPSLGRLFVAVGVFDGIHRGHTYLLRELRRAAQRAQARPAVITFDAHPEEITRREAPALLCDPDERLVRLAAAGVEVAVVQHFDAALRCTSYEDFVALIRERVDLAGFVMTPAAAFGYERRGTPEALTGLGRQLGFEVKVVPSFLMDNEQVRSSQIRQLIAEGKLDSARRLLGRWYGVTGRLEHDGKLEFELPFALPPSGTYPVLIGPAWRPKERPEPARREAEAVVEASGVVVKGGAVAETSLCARVVFRS